MIKHTQNKWKHVWRGIGRKQRKKSNSLNAQVFPSFSLASYSFFSLVRAFSMPSPMEPNPFRSTRLSRNPRMWLSKPDILERWELVLYVALSTIHSGVRWRVSERSWTQPSRNCLSFARSFKTPANFRHAAWFHTKMAELVVTLLAPCPKKSSCYTAKNVRKPWKNSWIVCVSLLSNDWIWIRKKRVGWNDFLVYLYCFMIDVGTV
jgi:hypothetical protein